MKPLRICIAANTTWYVYNFRQRLIRALIERGYEAIVYAPRDDYVARIEALGARHVHLAINNAGTNPIRELPALVRIATTLARERPAALLTYTPKVNIYCALAARVLGIPTIANVSGLGRAFSAGGWLETVSRSLYSLALKHPAVVFFQNEEDRAEFASAGLVDRAKTERLPGSGVDLDRFAPQAARAPDGRFVFQLVARMLWDKGVGVYVDAARMVRREFPHAEFRLAGFLDVENPSAVPRADVEAWEAEGITRYLGVSDSMTDIYAAADCVVLPSYYREGVPRSLLEAAAMARPIITTDSVGCRDTVDADISGFLCRARDAGDLARCMLRMIRLPAEARAVLGANGREKMVREFDERVVLKRYLETLQRLLAAPMPATGVPRARRQSE